MNGYEAPDRLALGRRGQNENGHVGTPPHSTLPVREGRRLKSNGAAHVTGIDKVDRSGVAEIFGVDEMVHSASDKWAAELRSESEHPMLIVEAVGHQVGTLNDAVEALAMNGHIYCFGIPDDEVHPFPLRKLLRRSGHFSAGSTLRQHRRRALEKAQEHLIENPHLLDNYVTDVLATEEPNMAFELAVMPEAGQLKIAMRA